MCRGYKSGNRCIYDHRCLFRLADGEKKPSARSRKEGTEGALAILRGKKKSKVVYLKQSDPMNFVLWKAGEFGLNASAGHTMKFSGRTGTKLKFGKEKGNLEAVSKKVNLVSEILARPVRRNNHTSKAAWNLARKYASSKPKIKLRFILFWKKGGGVCCGFGSFNARC